ncbi:hypothetical protein ACE10X_44600 [Bradyrhizobium sp. Pha-3]|uniref:hypothetical protein n=1 Tax=Bradyrhizobium sp. Pha-3 TaxID=208375 RepID=UPI0035D4055F
MFIFRHFFTLIFLVALGLAGHVVWFANTHHGSNPRIDYWPPYCVAAPITTDVCALVLSLANYSGQYEYSFGHYTPAGASIRQLVRIKDGLPMALPVAPGTLDDPDSDASKARIAACLKEADELQRGLRRLDSMRRLDCRTAPGFAEIVEGVEKKQAVEVEAKNRLLQEQQQRQLGEEVQRANDEIQRRRTMQDPRRGFWTR